MKRLFVSVAAIAVMTGSAMAGGWTGVYGGVYTGYFNGPDSGTVGVDLGANYELGQGFVIGGEVQGGYVYNYGDYELLGQGRLGYLLTNDVLLYGLVGGGNGAGVGVYSLGGGIEVMAPNNLSFAGELEGISTGSGFGYWRGVGKLNYHFN